MNISSKLSKSFVSADRPEFEIEITDSQGDDNEITEEDKLWNIGKSEAKSRRYLTPTRQSTPVKGRGKSRSFRKPLNFMSSLRLSSGKITDAERANPKESMSTLVPNEV